MTGSAQRGGGIGGLLLVGGLLFIAASAGPKPRPAPRRLPSDDWQTMPSDYTEADVEALARMLSSESSDPAVRTAIGWTTVEFAHRTKLSLFRLLTGKSGKYGHQKYFYPDGREETRYASTYRLATPTTRELARGLLAGSVSPPALLARTKPGAYVQLSHASKELGPDGKPLQPAYTPERILAKQASFGGIVGRVKDWFFYAKGAAPITSIDHAATV